MKCEETRRIGLIERIIILDKKIQPMKSKFDKVICRILSQCKDKGEKNNDCRRD